MTESVKRDLFLADEPLRLDVGGVVVFAKVKDGPATVKLQEIAGKGHLSKKQLT